MTESVFEKEAGKYWARSLPIVPTKGKVPVLAGWTGLLGGTPSEAKQTELLRDHGGANIGLLLGFGLAPDQVVAALDVDDDNLVKLVLRLLGLSSGNTGGKLVGKRGKKGATVFVRTSKTLKSTVIKGAADHGNIDFLAAGKMTVMPPSIHPDTGKPYEAFGDALLDADFADLPELNEHQIKLLKVALGSEHLSALISGKATHDSGVALTAAVVSAGASDEEIEAIILGALPDNYTGDSASELPEWIESARAKDFGEPQQGTLTQLIIEIALGAGVDLFNDGDGNAFATVPHTGPAVALRIGSSSFAMWLRHLVHTKLQRPIGTGPLHEAVATLTAIALFDRQSLPVHARVAGNNKKVVVDLGGDNGRYVEIGSGGWHMVASSEFRFVRGSGFRELPHPVEGAGLTNLLAFLGLDDTNCRLLLAFLIGALRPNGPYFILLVEGEQGSGKSFFCEMIKRILDPNLAIRLRLPDKPQDLMIQAKEYRLLSFDNASGMSAEMSDALCSLATGGGIAVRRLYSDGDLYVMSYSRPFVINGIGGYASRPDLIERGIPIRLEPMPEDGRKTEAELMLEFERVLPAILGGLFSAVSHALRMFDAVEPPKQLRMADAARWIRASEDALDVGTESLTDAIVRAQQAFVIDRISEDPLFMKLRAIARTKAFDGYIGDLYGEIVLDAQPNLARSLPKSPSQLSNQLKRMRPAMATAGLLVQFLDKDRKGRRIKVSLAPIEDEKAPQ